MSSKLKKPDYKINQIGPTIISKYSKMAEFCFTDLNPLCFPPI